MDKYGLAENERNTNLHEYNHALFRSQMVFMDVMWEINILTGTVVVLEDKGHPEENGREFIYSDLFQTYIEHRIREDDMGVFLQHMSPESLKNLRQEESLELHMLGKDGQLDLHQVILEPSMDEENVLSCVYFSARNIQVEFNRSLTEHHGQEQFKDALMSGSYFHFDFDVTGDGLIHGDFVTKGGFRPIQLATGMELPIPFETFVQKWREIYRPEFDTEQEDDIFTLDYLERAFARGEHLIYAQMRQHPPEGSGITEYMQIFVVLTQDPVDSHIHAFVIWREANAFRRDAIDRSLELRNSNRRLQSSNEQLRRTVSREEQFRMATISGSLMVYNINLTKDLIENEFYEIVDGKNYPMLQLVGLTAPCSFDEFCRRWSEAKVAEDSRQNFLDKYNRRYLLDAYERGERLVEIEFDTVIGRGIPVTLRNTALLVRDNDSGDILAMVNGKDVSAIRKEERRKREALRRAYELANNASATKTAFLARMSHDIRTPMNAIIGMTAIAKTCTDDKDRLKDCLNKIDISSKHLLGLINEVLDMSKIESGKLTLQEEDIVLPELIDSILAMCRSQIDEKHHSLSVKVHDIIHEKVVGDSQRIQQVFMNLMSNAIKYTPDGGKLGIYIREKPSGQQHVGCYEFIFEDNGIGMSEDFLPHFFEPFSREENERTSGIQGTGLGMSIVQSMVKMMNGTIDVDSSPGKGTKITVTIILRLQENNDEISVDSLAGLPILVTDNEEDVCIFTCNMLNELGMKSEYSLSGRQAVEMVTARHKNWDDYFAVILDWKMPGMDGVATARAIREQVGDSMPIIILSAYDWTDIEQEARAAGANAFISKPLFKSRLMRVFASILGQPVLQEEEEDRQTTIEDLAEADFGGRLVLLVEDNDLNAEIAVEILGMAGLTLERAHNGREAVEMVANAEDGHYGLIFMDIQMPVMDGYDATRAIRALPGDYPRNVPILAMSANTFADDVLAAKAAGMNDHIGKPLDFGQLEAALKKWLK